MLPEHEWLEQAKRLAVGMKTRVKHRSERRPNMIIANDTDKYWAYCQACKEGAVLPKTHVKYTGVVSPERERSNLHVPSDMVRVLGSEHEEPIERFLASKCMHLAILPDALYSHSRKRLVLETTGIHQYGATIPSPAGKYIGRDVTGNAAEKWLTYNGTQFLRLGPHSDRAVVLEDAFSWRKLFWAYGADCTMYCSLGTGQSKSLLLELLTHKEVVFFYDGDAAGYRGAGHGVSAVRALGVAAVAACAPAGLDPKDMTTYELRAHLEGAWQSK